MNGDDRWKDGVDDAIRDLRREVDSLKTWRAFVLGGVAVVTFVLGMASHEVSVILHKLGA